MATRKYHSPLRSQQAIATRRRIIEAAGRITLFDFARVTHAAVARAAKVAERTVYRYFPTVASLQDAFAKHLEERVGRDHADEFAIDDLAAMYERWPARLKDTGMLDHVLEQHEPRVLATSRRQRYARIERALAPLVPDATPTQRRQLVLVFGALLSVEVFRRGKVVLGLAPEKVVPGPAWALRILVEALRKGETPWT